MRTWDQGVAAIKAMVTSRKNIGENNCKSAAREAFDIPSNGTATATASWTAAPDRHPATQPTGIPDDCFVWWTGGRGHVAVKTGGVLYSPGTVDDPEHWVATSFATVARFGHTLAGWTHSIDGKTPARPTKDVTPVTSPFVKPPKVPGRFAKFAHLMPYRFGNSVAGLRKGKRLGYKASDTDIRPSKQGTAWAIHWNLIRQNGTYHYKSTGKPVPKGLKVSQATDAQLRDMRSSDGRRFWTAAQMIRRAKRLGYQRLELELKAKVSVTEWKRLKTVAGNQGLTIHAKTLLLIPGAYKRLAIPAALGVPTILSATGYKGRAARRLAKVTTWTRGGVTWES